MSLQNPAHIDPNHLDREWVHQSECYHQAALDAAGARLKHAELTQELELVYAELDHQIRTHPARYNLGDKLTEKIVENTVVLQASYRVALKAVYQAKFELDTFQAMVGALEHKKKGLENLVSLRLADYYAEPRTPKGGSDEVEEMQRRELRSRGQRKWQEP